MSDSKPPIYDRYAEYPPDSKSKKDHPFVRAVDWVLKYWVYLLTPAFIILHFVGWLHWAKGLTTVLLIRLGVHLFGAERRQATFGLIRKHKKVSAGLGFALLLSPVYAPYLFTWYGKAMTSDPERVMNPPKVYYVWLVDEAVFDTEEDRKRLKSLNPSGDNNGRVKQVILLAARAVNIDAEMVVPFGDPPPKQDEPFSVVIFESYRELKEVSESPSAEEGKEDEESMPPKTRKFYVSRLRITVITPNVKREEEDEKSEKKKPHKTPGPKTVPHHFAAYTVPESLDLSTYHLAQTFAEASGKGISYKDLGLLIQQRKEEHKQRQRKNPVPREDGPG